MKKIIKSELHNITGGYIKFAHFADGKDIFIDPDPCDICASGYYGYAVYDDATDKYLKGFIGEPASLKNALEDARKYCLENGLSVEMKDCKVMMSKKGAKLWKK